MNIFPVFVRRGTAGARPLTTGARAPAGPGFAPPLAIKPPWFIIVTIISLLITYLQFKVQLAKYRLPTNRFLK